MKFLCIGLVIVAVLLASSLAMPRKQYARKQYANYLEEEKDLMQMQTVAQDVFGSLNAREYTKSLCYVKERVKCMFIIIIDRADFIV